jgi:hypothetical protein
VKRMGTIIHDWSRAARLCPCNATLQGRRGQEQSPALPSIGKLKVILKMTETMILQQDEVCVCVCAPLCLPSERASLSQTSLSTSGLSEHLRAGAAQNDGVGVREHSGDGEASGALDIHVVL